MHAPLLFLPFLPDPLPEKSGKPRPANDFAVFAVSRSKRDMNSRRIIPYRESKGNDLSPFVPVGDQYVQISQKNTAKMVNCDENSKKPLFHEILP